MGSDWLITVHISNNEHIFKCSEWHTGCSFKLSIKLEVDARVVYGNQATVDLGKEGSELEEWRPLNIPRLGAF